MKTKFQLFLFLLLLVSAVLIAPKYSEASESENRESPNIVFILADDMGYGDLVL